MDLDTARYQNIDKAILELNYKRNIKALYQHNKIFNIEKDFFKEFITKESVIECSVKIEKNNIFAKRYNLWYDCKLQEAIKKFIEIRKILEKKYSARFDLKLFKETIKKINPQKIEQIIIGTDFRKNIDESRLKIWFIVKDVQTIKKFVEDFDITTKKLYKKDELLIGFDFSFDKKTKIKIYPMIIFKELSDSQKVDLKKEFGENTYLILEESEKFHITKNNDDYILHIKLKNFSKIKTYISNKKIIDILSKLQANIISCSLNEIETKKINSANIYYSVKNI